MILLELVPLLKWFQKQQRQWSTKKTESEISYGPAVRENQFKQNKISSEEKVKFTISSSREIDKKRKKFLHDNFGGDEKEQLKRDDIKRKKQMRDNLEKEEKEY